MLEQKCISFFFYQLAKKFSLSFINDNDSSAKNNLPSEVSGVHAIVKHKDSGDLAETEISQRNHKAVSKGRRRQMRGKVEKKSIFGTTYTYILGLLHFSSVYIVGTKQMLSMQKVQYT